jgi:hypothetical protein
MLMVGRGCTVAVLVALATACTDSDQRTLIAPATLATTANASTSLPPTSAPRWQINRRQHSGRDCTKHLLSLRHRPVGFQPTTPTHCSDIVVHAEEPNFSRFFSTGPTLLRQRSRFDHRPPQTPGDTSDDPSFAGYIVEGGTRLLSDLSRNDQLSPPASAVPSSIPCSALFDQRRHRRSSDVGRAPFSAPNCRSVPDTVLGIGSLAW